MKNLPLLSLFLIVLVSAFSCSRSRTAATLDDVETYIQERPDSALATIRAIDTTTLTTRSLRAHYALLHAIALDKCWIDTTDTGVIMPAVEYYSSHGSPERRAKAYYYLGRIQENGNEKAQAIVSFMRADKIVQKSGDIRFKCLIASSTARLFSKSFDYDEALLWDQAAYDRCIAAGDSFLINSCRQRLAIDYYNLEQYALSDSIYRVIYADTCHIYTQLLPDILSGYALLNVTMQDFDKACSLYRQALKIRPSFSIENHWGAYAYALSRIGRLEQSDKIFNLLEQKGRSASLSYLVWKSRAEASNTDYSEAYRLLEMSNEIQEKNLRRAMGQTVLKSQRDIFKEDSLRQEKEKRLNIIISCLVLALLLMCLVVLSRYLLQRSRQAKERENALLETTRSLALEKDKLQKDRASLYGQYAAFMQRHFKDLGELFKTTASVNEGNLWIKKDLVFDKVIQAWQAVLSDKEGVYAFERQLNESFDNVLTHLREELPRHEEEYYRFAGYVFAGFDSDLLMVLTHTKSRDSVYSRKKRLRKDILQSDAPHKNQFLLLLS